MKASWLKMFACKSLPVAEDETRSIDNSSKHIEHPIQDLDERHGLDTATRPSQILEDIEEEVEQDEGNGASSSHNIPVPSPCQSIRSRLSRPMSAQQKGGKITIERSATEPIISFSLLGIPIPAKKERLGQSKTFVRPVSPAPPVTLNVTPTIKMRQIAAAKIRAVAAMYAERAQASRDRAALSLRQAELEIERKRSTERMTALGASKILQMTRSNYMYRQLKKNDINRYFDPRRTSESTVHPNPTPDQDSAHQDPPRSLG